MHVVCKRSHFIKGSHSNILRLRTQIAIPFCNEKNWGNNAMILQSSKMYILVSLCLRLTIINIDLLCACNILSWMLVLVADSFELRSVGACVRVVSIWWFTEF